MALNDCSIWGCAKAPQLGFATFQRPRSRLGVNLKHDIEKCCKRKCCCLSVLNPIGLTPVEDEKPAVNGFESFGNVNSWDRGQLSELEAFLYGVQLLYKPLMAGDYCLKRHGSRERVSYKGAPGAYCEEAALKAYPKCETVPCEDFETSFKLAESGFVDKAVVPIESSVAGSIHQNYDLLAIHKLHIVGEVHLLTNLFLLGLAGVRKEELKCVMSDPEVLVQCKNMLTDLGAANTHIYDTAAAAKVVALTGRKEIGAIASSRAAKLYNLDILAEGIQDDDVNNITRFLILASDPIMPGIDGTYKTSIVFTLKEGSSMLFKALGAFALRNINLSKIERRPMNQCQLRVDNSNDGSAKYFDYLFYIDFETSTADPSAQHALENLQEYTRFIRVLGCYPMDTTDISGPS